MHKFLTNKYANEICIKGIKTSKTVDKVQFCLRKILHPNGTVLYVFHHISSSPTPLRIIVITSANLKLDNKSIASFVVVLSSIHQVPNQEQTVA